ncbi:MAG: HAMP domain-containing sensor histidine kinase [Daejeonella sp.]
MKITLNILLSILLLTSIASIVELLNAGNILFPAIVLILSAAALGFIIYLKTIVHADKNLDAGSTHNENNKFTGSISLQADHLAEKKHFASILSHDMRSPISSIVLVTSMIKNGNNYPELHHFLDMVEKSAKKELSMISMLHSLMKSDAEEEFLFQHLHLNLLVDKSLQEIKEQVKLDKVNLSINISPELQIVANPVSIGLVLNNILLNAIQFAKAGTELEINAKEEKDTVVIEVKEKKLEFKNLHDFTSVNSDEIRQASNFKESREGIGFYFCKKIIQNHNGTIQAFTDNPEKGASYRITLPATDKQSFN